MENTLILLKVFHMTLNIPQLKDINFSAMAEMLKINAEAVKVNAEAKVKVEAPPQPVVEDEPAFDLEPRGFRR